MDTTDNKTITEDKGNVVNISDAKSRVLKSMQEKLDKMLKDPVILCLDRNENGDADLYVRENRDDLRFDLATKDTWFIWNGHNWTEDIKNKAFVFVGKVTKVYSEKLEEIIDILQNFAGVDKDDPIKKEYISLLVALQKRNFKLNSLDRQLHVVTLAKARGLGAVPTIWDSDPTLLGCANGILNLMTGEFRPGRREDYIRSYSPTEWKGANEPCPLWEKTISEIFNHDKDMIAFIQRVLGYALLGYVKDHVFFIFYGDKGFNGKGVIMNTCKAVLGRKLAAQIRSELLIKSKQDKAEGAPNSALMVLRAKRLVWASETDEGQTFSSEKVKWLTGGDELCGRNPYDKREQDWEASHTLFLITNHLPHVQNDNAFWERTFPVEFTQSFVRNPQKEYEHQMDDELEHKLKEEVSGILAWMVRGTYKCLKQGLNPPEAVLNAKEKYIENEDTLGRFIKAGFFNAAAAGMNIDKRKEPLSEIHEAYKQWCDEVGIKNPMYIQKLAEKLEKRGFPKRGGHANKTYIHGIQFLPEKWNKMNKRWINEIDVEDDDD